MFSGIAKNSLKKIVWFTVSYFTLKVKQVYEGYFHSTKNLKGEVI